MPVSSQNEDLLATPTQHRRARAWNRASIGVGLLALVGVQQALVVSPYPVRRLPNGTDVGLVGVTLKNPKTIVVGSAWDRLQAFARDRGSVHTTRVELPVRNSPTVWLHFSQWEYSDPPLVVLRNASGDEWFGERDMSDVGNERSFGLLIGQSFPVFPRRERLLTLRVYQTAGGSGSAPPRWVDFSFPNPTPFQGSNWIPEPFPVARQNGDIKVALTSLRTGGKYLSGTLPAPISTSAVTVATFRVTRNGSPAPEWEPVELACSDATGNRISGYEERLTRMGDEVGFPINEQLPSDEAAWKVRAEFSRFRAAREKPDHTWTVAHVPIPRYGATSRWQNTRIAPGLLLQTQLNARPEEGIATVNIRLLAKGKRNMRMALRVEDDIGHTFRVGDLGWQGNFGKGEWEWQLGVSTAARFMNLTLGGFESRTVEFLVRPTRLQ